MPLQNPQGTQSPQTPQQAPQAPTIPPSESRLKSILKKLKKPLLIALPIVVALIITIFIVQHFISKSNQSQATYPQSSISLITADFQSGKLSADNYLTYLIYASYDMESLPQEYQSTRMFYAPDFLTIIEENRDQLSEEAINKALDVIYLTGIELNPDASSNKTSLASPAAQNAYADTNVFTVLDEAKTCGSKRFVIFYTTTGDSAITDSTAQTLCQDLTSFTNSYKSVFGLDWNYQVFLEGDSSRQKAAKDVLKASGLSQNLIKTAMPVYVANPYTSSNAGGVYAQYCGREITQSDLTGPAIKGGGSRPYPSTPFIIIVPQKLNLSSSFDFTGVLAHELAHYYSHERNYQKFGNNGNTADFTNETLANYMANLVYTNQSAPGENNAFGIFHNDYINFGTNYPIDQTPPAQIGFGTFAFLQNYAEIVSDGQTKVLDTQNSSTPLKDLINNATSNEFHKVMQTLAERNLTNTYSTNGLIAVSEPPGQTVPCTDTCNDKGSIAAVSSHYYYFDTNTYKDDVVTFENAVLDFSLLKYTGSSWQVVSSKQGRLEVDFTKENSASRYAVAVANSQSHSVVYSINITNDPPAESDESEESEEPEESADSTADEPAESTPTNTYQSVIDVSADGSCQKGYTKIQTSIIGGAGAHCYKNDGSGIFAILNIALDILTFGVGILATIGVMISGYRYLTAKDDASKVQKAKDRLVQIVIGLAIYAIIWAVLEFLLPGGLFGNGS